eukprot:sb/3472842/
MRHTLAIMDPSDRLRYHDADINHLQLLAPLQFITHRYGVTHHNLVNLFSLFQLLRAAPRHDTMGHHHMDLDGTLSLEESGCIQEGPTLVNHVVDNDGYPVLDISHHPDGGFNFGNCRGHRSGVVKREDLSGEGGLGRRGTPPIVTVLFALVLFLRKILDN